MPNKELNNGKPVPNNPVSGLKLKLYSVGGNTRPVKSGGKAVADAEAWLEVTSTDMMKNEGCANKGRKVITDLIAETETLQGKLFCSGISNKAFRGDIKEYERWLADCKAENKALELQVAELKAIIKVVQIGDLPMPEFLAELPLGGKITTHEQSYTMGYEVGLLECGETVSKMLAKKGR